MDVHDYRFRESTGILQATATADPSLVLDVLATVDEPVNRSTIAEALVDANTFDATTTDSATSDSATSDSTETAEARSERLQRAELELHHRILPKLDEVDVLATTPPPAGSRTPRSTTPRPEHDLSPSADLDSSPAIALDERLISPSPSRHLSVARTTSGGVPSRGESASAVRR